MKHLIEDTAGVIYIIDAMYDSNGKCTEDRAEVVSVTVETDAGWFAVEVLPRQVFTVH